MAVVGATNHPVGQQPRWVCAMDDREYLTGFRHRWRAMRLLGMSLMFQAMLLRSLLLFKRELGLLLASCLALARALGCSFWLPLGLAYAAAQLWCACEAAARVEVISGHRAGAKDYAGEHCENTVEAMQALVAADNGPGGPIRHLHYVEIDIQETADGELIVLHDSRLQHAFPDAGPNSHAYQALRAAGVPEPVTHTQVSALTAAQLRSLCLAARPGLHAPTLRDFMAAFRAARCRRPLVVEIKGLRSDAGRKALLQLVKEHKLYAEQQAALHGRAFADPQLGYFALIAFPHHFARSVGEPGSAAWRRWCSAYGALVPVRCCFLERLSYCYGLPGTLDGGGR